MTNPVSRACKVRLILVSSATAAPVKRSLHGLPSFRSGISPNAVVETIREWNQCNKVEFIWCGIRDRTKEATLDMLKNGGLSSTKLSLDNC